MPAEPSRQIRLLSVAPVLAALALGGCSRGQGFTEFATNVRDRVAGDAASEESQRSLRRASPDGGNGLIRPKARPSGAAQAGGKGDQASGDDNATGSGSASGAADAPSKPTPPPVIYFYPSSPAPAAPSQ